MIQFENGQRVQKTQLLLTILGRALLAAIFLMSALGEKIPDFAGTTEYMAANGVPFPQVLLVGAIGFLLVGGVSVVVGYRAKLGAALLAVFLILATYFFHDFWSHSPESQEYQIQMIQFLKNAALLGAMLLIMANGAGPGSLDNLTGEIRKGEEA